jgi:hypothetical protein
MKSFQKFLQFDDASTKTTNPEIKVVPVDLGREPDEKVGRAQKRRKSESASRVDVGNEAVFEEISVLIVSRPFQL